MQVSGNLNKNKMLKVERTTANNPSYHFFYDGVYIGDAELDENGLFAFHFVKEQQENWTNKSLKTIVAKLDKLDKQKEH